MKTENIKVKFKIHTSCNKPDLNRRIYTKEAFEKVYGHIQNTPIGIYDTNGAFIPIAIAQEIELVKCENGEMFIEGVGVTKLNELLEIDDRTTTQYLIRGEQNALSNSICK